MSPSTNPKWIVVSNRLPFQKGRGSGVLQPSSGGLVSALSGIRSEASMVWVGAAPQGITEGQFQSKAVGKFEVFYPVFIPNRIHSGYYNKISNDVIWPIFHYESGLAHFNWEDWAAYKKANELFADQIAKIANPGDMVWVHDYHLFLLPRYLRRKMKRLKIGFFLHIPFPSSEVFRQLPVRTEILKALLDSDLVGFHDYSYLRHFISSVQNILGFPSSLLNVQSGKRNVRMGVFPVSIDTQKFIKKSASKEVAQILSKLKKEKKSKYLILGVDRLDYIKGIELKLQAFKEMLKRFPDLAKEVTLLQIAIPTRLDVPEYVNIRHQVESLVGEINGEFGRPNRVPVQYMYSSVPFEELLALYRLADVLLVSSKRDGMNLVALEYIASQNPEDPGAVVLSEFAGAISTLSHVFPVNPWDIVESSMQIAKAIQIPKKNRIELNRPMRKYLQNYTSQDWASSFMRSLENTAAAPKEEQVSISVSSQTMSFPQSVRTKIQKGTLVLLMDYDGTLVPIHETPDLAVLSSRMKEILRKLNAKKNIHLAVVSGRNSKFLDEQLRGLNLFVAAEHGAKFFDPKRNRWRSLVHTDRQSWYPSALRIIEDYSARVPNSFVEKKEHSVSWHYRKSPTDFASYQSRKLHEELEIGLSSLPVSVLAGKKVIEVRAIEANKGSFARWFFDTRSLSGSEIVMAIGDDQTDEDMFVSVPEGGVTIKIGEGSTHAKYRLTSQEDVEKFLQKLSNF